MGLAEAKTWACARDMLALAWIDRKASRREIRSEVAIWDWEKLEEEKRDGWKRE